MTMNLAKRSAVEISVAALVGLILGIFGPFGTFSMPTGLRLIYWIAFLLIGYCLFRPLVPVARWLAERFAAPYWLAVALTLPISALPMAVVVEGMFSGFDLTAALRAPSFGQTIGYAGLIGLLMHVLYALLERDNPAKMNVPRAAEQNGIDQKTPNLAQRLPPGFGPILALAGEDHYVRIIGESREELVLLRMRDAIGELADTDGLRVHRSWWVARNAVRMVRRDGRSWVLILANGREVPVARDKSASLRQAGWLTG